MIVTILNSFFLLPNYLASFIPTETIFSTQGIMVMLLAAYAGAMWLFLSSAPKVHTIMVSDLRIARDFYEGLLNLPIADVPLHYYYNYQQTIGMGGIDPIYLSSNPEIAASSSFNASDGLWYQLKKNTQVHIISGANLGTNDRQRHICFDRDCLEQVLMRIQSRRLKYKIRNEKPLNFLVKDIEERVIEMSEVSN
jgi:hypothetical protein